MNENRNLDYVDDQLVYDQMHQEKLIKELIAIAGGDVKGEEDAELDRIAKLNVFNKAIDIEQNRPTAKNLNYLITCRRAYMEAKDVLNSIRNRNTTLAENYLRTFRTNEHGGDTQ